MSDLGPRDQIAGFGGLKAVVLLRQRSPNVVYMLSLPVISHLCLHFFFVPLLLIAMTPKLLRQAVT